MPKGNSGRMKLAVYALTRGYEWRFAYRYLALILRNLSLRVALIPRSLSYEISWLLFHEGNISKWQQVFIQILSLKRIKFVDISQDFKPPPGHHEGDFPIGYHLMCRFQYWGVWGHLKSYDLGLRVDEDCFVLQPPRFLSGQTIVVGALSPETHVPTLTTLQPFIDKIYGPKDLSEELFPYTNVMLCDLSFFRKSEVQTALKEFEAHPDAFRMRWGDLPILGLVSSESSGLGGSTAVDSKTLYFHMSHNSWVARGKLRE